MRRGAHNLAVGRLILLPVLLLLAGRPAGGGRRRGGSRARELGHLAREDEQVAVGALLVALDNVGSALWEVSHNCVETGRR